MLGAWSSCLSWDSSNRARPDPADPEKKHLQYLDKMSQLRVHLGIPKRTCSPNLQNGDGRTQMGSGFSGVFLADSQVSRRFPRFHLKMAGEPIRLFRKVDDSGGNLTEG